MITNATAHQPELNLQSSFEFSKLSALKLCLVCSLVIPVLHYLVSKRQPVVFAHSREKLAIEVSRKVTLERRAKEERLWINQLAAAVNVSFAAYQQVLTVEDTPRGLKLHFDPVLKALSENPLVSALEYGELEPIHNFAINLQQCNTQAPYDLSRSLDDYSDEDLKFLFGFIHWYLGEAYKHWRSRWGVDPLLTDAMIWDRESSLDQSKLKVFKKTDFQSFLGELD